jgi:predicted DsbA family dithiol-disulfide isomerase
MQQTTQPRIKVDIWSDIACPWCYIGKRRFEAALAEFPQRDQVDVVWHSFELDPSAALVNPMNARDNLAAKYGETSEGAQKMIDHMTSMAASEGLDFRFGMLKLTNTFQGHQVIHLAAEHGVQDAMKERLLKAYLSEGENLGDVDTLVRLAEDVGLDGGEVRAALERQTYAQAVRNDEAQAQAYEISGVPFFVFNDKYGVSGAQSPEVFLNALDQVWQEQRPLQLIQSTGNDAEGCEDGSCTVPQR